MTHRYRSLWCLFAILCGGVSAAHAQFAVIDVASVAQLLQQLQTLEQQVQTARQQLGQAKAEFQSITGDRGMEQLLAGTVRNYLPGDWSTLRDAMGGAGGYPLLTSAVRGALTEDTVLSAAQLARLGPAGSAQIQSDRRATAALQGLSRDALANASARFATLQQLIAAIGGAQDQKAALDLQARIGAEATMLQNEQNKLQALFQVAQAEAAASAGRARERALVGQGQFDLRFRPQP
ncbi:MAG: type IV secretion system family protein [Proteobacteria bacterium]|nr:type IV secretion system family protein [Pseudomonadota bacterium]